MIREKQNVPAKCAKIHVWHFIAFALFLLIFIGDTTPAKNFVYVNNNRIPCANIYLTTHISPAQKKTAKFIRIIDTNPDPPFLLANNSVVCVNKVAFRAHVR